MSVVPHKQTANLDSIPIEFLQSYLFLLHSFLKKEKIAFVILLDGLSPTGLLKILRQVELKLDPRYLHIHNFEGNWLKESNEAWLLPYWRSTPATGKTNILFYSYYQNMLKRAVIDKEDISTDIQDALAFEQTLSQAGIHLMKIWFQQKKAWDNGDLNGTVSEAETKYYKKLAKKWDKSTVQAASLLEQTDNDYARWHFFHEKSKNAGDTAKAALYHIANFMEQRTPHRILHEIRTQLKGRDDDKKAGPGYTQFILENFARE